jgi:hypothetical protein
MYVVESLNTALFEKHCWDRCYDFYNIFAEKFVKNIGVFLLKLLLVFFKCDHYIGLKNAIFFAENRRKWRS